MESMNTYEIFSGRDLEIADRIQKLRLCLLVHSCIYYNLNCDIVTDSRWDEWARELVKLQKDNAAVSEKVRYYEAFRDWDASTGAFLPINEPWVMNKAKYLLRISGTVSDIIVSTGTETAEQKKAGRKVSGKRKLF